MWLLLIALNMKNQLEKSWCELVFYRVRNFTSAKWASSDLTSPAERILQSINRSVSTVDHFSPSGSWGWCQWESERSSSLWTGGSSITGLTHNDRKPFTSIDANSSIHLTSMSLEWKWKSTVPEGENPLTTSWKTWKALSDPVSLSSPLCLSPSWVQVSKSKSPK